jgi:uncharacterized cupin superfamily protein
MTNWNIVKPIDESERKGPYRCPVCGGNGKVPAGFYNQTGGRWITSNAADETCRTCNGRGIVWRGE